MRVWVYTYMCTRIYVRVHTCMRMCVYTCVFVDARTCACARAHMCAYMRVHAYAHTYVYVYGCTCICVCVYVCVWGAVPTSWPPQGSPPPNWEVSKPSLCPDLPCGRCSPGSGPEEGFRGTRGSLSRLPIDPRFVSSLQSDVPNQPALAGSPPRRQEIGQACLMYPWPSPPPKINATFLSSRGSPCKCIDFWAPESPAPRLHGAEIPGSFLARPSHSRLPTLLRGALRRFWMRLWRMHGLPGGRRRPWLPSPACGTGWLLNPLAYSQFPTPPCLNF